MSISLEMSHLMKQFSLLPRCIPMRVLVYAQRSSCYLLVPLLPKGTIVWMTNILICPLICLMNLTILVEIIACFRCQIHTISPLEAATRITEMTPGRLLRPDQHQSSHLGLFCRTPRRRGGQAASQPLPRRPAASQPTPRRRLRLRQAWEQSHLMTVHQKWVHHERLQLLYGRLQGSSVAFKRRKPILMERSGTGC